MRSKSNRLSKKDMEKALDNLQWDFECKREIHPAWKEQQQEYFKKFSSKFSFANIIGKWQYFYTSELGDISMIRIKLWTNTSHNGKDFYNWVWEIYGYEKLFPDVIRFKTKAAAVQRIKQILCPTKKLRQKKHLKSK